MVISSKKRHRESARVKSYYRFIHSEPWPDSIRTPILAEEKRRKTAKQQGLRSHGAGDLM